MPICHLCGSEAEKVCCWCKRACCPRHTNFVGGRMGVGSVCTECRPRDNPLHALLALGVILVIWGVVKLVRLATG